MHKLARNQDLQALAASFILFVLISKFLFYKEGIASILQVSASLYWLFVLPGLLLTYSISRELGFMERYVLGFLLGAALYGVISYWLGMIGINIAIHKLIIPTAELALGILLLSGKKAHIH